jgi:hypothetical protein
MNTKYEIIFRGASYKNRAIEVYLPEYKHSQWIVKHPVGSKYLFGFTDDDFWRAHPDLKKEFNVICHNIAIKHLSFVVGWDIRETENTYEWWEFAVKQWKEEGYIKLTDEEFDIALKSYYNKYTREKGKRVYKYIPPKIYNYQDKIELLEQAIDLAGDGGCDPFTEEERIILNDFLIEIKNKFINKD